MIGINQSQHSEQVFQVRKNQKPSQTLQNAANITDSDELTVTGSTLVKYLDQNQQTFNANSERLF